MTAQADQIRDKRRAYATPGGIHDRLLRLAADGLPAIVGALLATMVVLPLFPKSEVSFLLDRNRVAITDNRLAVDSATYRGEDDNGKAFIVTAGNVVQHSARVPVVQMERLDAHMQLSDGTAEAIAPTGDYHLDTDQMVVRGPVKMTTTNGYSMLTSTVSIDLKKHRAFGNGGVTGQLTTGPFAADSISADLEARTISLDGHAHLRIEQGKMRTLR